MKKLLCLLLCLSPITVFPAVAQQPAPASAISPTNAPEPKLTRFDLDFPGGSPAELVAAIQKSMGKPINVIVPTEHADFRLPSLKMKDVTLSDLFAALTAAERSSNRIVHKGGTSARVEIGFSTAERSRGPGRDTAPVKDDSVWFFYANSVASSPTTPQATRFHLLTPYLDAGLTVDDITTAIRTAWKMRGDTATPALSFHKETKLLIAVGETSQLSTVDDVLRALDVTRGAKQSAAASPAPKTEDRKAER